MGLVPGSGRSPGGVNGNLLQYFCQENPINRGVRQATVHGLTELDRTEHAHRGQGLPTIAHFDICMQLISYLYGIFAFTGELSHT